MRILNRAFTAFTWVFVGLACAAITATAQQSKQGTAVVRSVSGSASYLDELGVSHPLAVGSVVKEGQSIHTGLDGTVDLFLGSNGPGVALEANSQLLVERLNSWESPLGTMIDTRLNLKQGKLYGTVQKLLPGSNYEVKMPTGVARVRGTEFFIDSKTGSVDVVSGTVNVTVVLATETGPLTKAVPVTAGYSLTVPQQFKNLAAFNALAPSKTPPGMSATNLRRLAQLGLLTRYTSPNPTSSVKETFEAEQKKNGQIKVDKPPRAIVVSP